TSLVESKDTHIVVSAKFEFELYRLFEPFEAPKEVSISFTIQATSIPIAFLFFQSRHPQKLINGLLRIIHLDLLGIIVFILDPDISRLVVVGILIFEVVAVAVSKSPNKRGGRRTPRHQIPA